MPSVWSTYFAVDDTLGAVETAKANGGQVTYGPLGIADASVLAGLTDPYGANFTVIQLAQPVA